MAERHAGTHDALTAIAAVATLNDIRTMFQSLLSEYAYWVDESWVSVSMFAP